MPFDSELLALRCRSLLTTENGGRRPFPLPGDSAHYGRDRLADVRHIRLEIGFDLDARAIAGIVHHTLAPINAGLTAIDFDAAELEIASVNMGGVPLAHRLSGDSLHIDFGRALTAGEEVTLSIAYTGHPRRGFYFNLPDDGYPNRPRQIWTQSQDEDARHWLPCYDFPNQKATTEVIATVPAGWFALSNGVLEARRENTDGTLVYHWRQTVPHVTYLMTLVAGDYVEVPDRLESVPVPYYVPPGQESDARRAFGRTPEMIRFFGEKIGVPYPYEKYAQIVVTDFIFGGMENTTATTMTDAILYDERAALDTDRDSLVAHELAHQWFGDLLTCKEWAHAWLNEGFATYFDLLFQEHHKGADEFAYARTANADIYFGEDSGHYRRPIVCNVYNEPIDIFDRHLYEKGSLVLHMLRYVLGDDLWWKAINHYVTKHARNVVATPDLQRAIEEATGRNLDRFFDQWVHHAGHPEYKVNWTWDDAAKLANVTVKQTHRVDDSTMLFSMPILIDFRKGDAVHEFRVTIDQKEQTLHFPLLERPKMVRFDPGNHVLKKLEFDKPVDELAHQLAHDPDVMGRVAAAKALGKQGGPKAIEALAAAVRNDAFWGAQAEAAKALGATRSTAARDALINLRGIPHPKARRGVVQALGEFRHDERAADALLPAVRGDASYFVEGSATISLSKTRSPRAYDAIAAQFDKPSYNETLRVMACNALAELKEERAIDFLLGWTPYGRPQQVRSAAIAALAALADHFPDHKTRVVERLTELLNDPWLRTRLSAAEGLGKLGDGIALGPLDAYIARELDGRGVRVAREAMAKIREGKGRDDETKKMREDLDKAMADNRELRDRLDKLETLVLPSADGAADRSATERMNA